MTATNGSAVPTRRRGRVLGCIMTLALALSALVFAPAAANAETTTYLSLGDSISFGYTAEKFKENFPNEAPAYFEEGFTNAFLNRLAGKEEVGKGITLVNDACPGETSNGLIGENTAIFGQASTEPATSKIQGPGDWHPCAYNNVNGLPLHNSLSIPTGETGKNSISQLEDALSILNSPKEGEPAHPVKVITLNIGSNDELAGVAECKKEIEEEFGSKFYALQPNTVGAPNYHEFWGPLNGNPAHDGPIEFQAFKACLIGKSLYYQTPYLVEQIAHIVEVLDGTSPGAGHFTGRLIVMGFYNPDAFTLPGSDGLQANLNSEILTKLKALAGAGFANLSFANPFLVFNKGNLTTEQANICKYTEMCNPNVQASPPSTPAAPVGKDGDIHPTKVGATALGKLANEAYLAPPIT